MIMFILFLLIIITGFVFFVVVYLKESRQAQDVPTGTVPPVAGEEGALTGLIELKAVKETLESRILKLEQMIDEKNREIRELKEGGGNDLDQAAQAEQLKQIFQQQIEELKIKNAGLKEDLEQALQENLDLQTRIYAMNSDKVSSAPGIGVRAVPPPDLISAAVAAPGPEREPELEVVIPPAQPPVEKPVRKIGGLSLHDIFSDEKNGQ